jgi:hypothetical protein
MTAQPRRPADAQLRAMSLLLMFALGCERTPDPVPVDSSGPAPRGPSDTSTTSTRMMWDLALGPVFIVSGEGRNDASVVFPMFSDSTLTDTTTFDTSVVAGMTVDLFSRGGHFATARLQPMTRRPPDGCVVWPGASVVLTEPAAPPTGEWTVGFTSGRVFPLALDSLENLAGSDSARLTADVARLASLVPEDTAKAFHGIPFFVRQVRRFRTSSGLEVLVANVIRRINQEANPREEQLLLIAERGGRPSAGDGGSYSLGYHERVSGHEEAIETTDVLAALMLGPSGPPAIVLIRDYGDGTAYALLTRAASGDWRVGWSSAYAGC